MINVKRIYRINGVDVAMGGGEEIMVIVGVNRVFVKKSLEDIGYFFG